MAPEYIIQNGTLEWIKELASIPLTILYMLGIVYLYKANQDLVKEIKALVERYHVLVSEQVRTLDLLADRLEDKR